MQNVRHLTGGIAGVGWDGAIGLGHAGLLGE
jgi:hypothetical protein